MKKHVQLLCIMALIAIIGMTSCTKKPEDLIVGKWKITEYREEGSYISKVEGDTWTFKDNGTFTGPLIAGEHDISCKYVCDDNELTLKGGGLDELYYQGYPAEITYKLDIDDISKDILIVSGKARLYVSGYGENSWSISVELKRK